MGEVQVQSRNVLRVDQAWEFAAPKYFDFSAVESESDIVEAESWFQQSADYGASPNVTISSSVQEARSDSTKFIGETVELYPDENDRDLIVNCNGNNAEALKQSKCASPTQNKENEAMEMCSTAAPSPSKLFGCGMIRDLAVVDISENVPSLVADMMEEPCTPKISSFAVSKNVERTPLTDMASQSAAPPGSLPAKRLHSDAWKESQGRGAATMPKAQKTFSARNPPPTTAKKKQTPVLKSVVNQEDQAQKKQKLDGGRLRQIMSAKEQLPRIKENPSLTVPQEFQFCTVKRSRAHGGVEMGTSISSQAGRINSPFVSMAEKVQRFQMRTPERFRPNSSYPGEDDHEKGKMKLTRPKTPDFETSHRTRATRVKSTAELEEEMLAKLPKFKARPAPKKILEAAPTPFVVRKKTSTVVPEVQVFHLRTTERAGTVQNIAPSVSASMDSEHSSVIEDSRRRKSAPGDVHESREPQLQTAMRVRPLTVKSREQLELEELANMPKFKARPINKKIFKSRGDLGIFRNQKREVTIPQEFHFATNERIQQKEFPLIEQFNKISLQQHNNEHWPRLTVPEPFHLETEDRGLIKEKRFLQESAERELELLKARNPRANPLPWTTEIPDIPPKPEPKEPTKPAPFQLESVLRHEDELQRLAEERAREEELEAALKAFRAQPNLSNVLPVFVPERSRKPLTEVQEFAFQLEARAVDRAQFDKRVLEKQNQYKRFREEIDAAKKAEEERNIKAMRKEMVPHARPMPLFDRPFIPQRRSLKELTRPVSPQFHPTISRQHRRRSSMALGRRMHQLR